MRKPGTARLFVSTAYIIHTIMDNHPGAFIFMHNNPKSIFEGKFFKFDHSSKFELKELIFPKRISKRLLKYTPDPESQYQGDAFPRNNEGDFFSNNLHEIFVGQDIIAEVSVNSNDHVALLQAAVVCGRSFNNIIGYNFAIDVK